MVHRRVAVTDGAGLGEDVEAAEVWAPNGHRQVRQNGSSALVTHTHTHPFHPSLLEMSRNVYGWVPKEGALHKG